MDCTKASSQPWGVAATNDIFPANEALSWSFRIPKLQSEKEVLEDGLANCVTYLQVLCKKQARTERRLVTDSSLSRKKRKKIQQGKRELEKEIKHRERDEQAFLNNLQACKANIYMAETISMPSTAISSTMPDIASISTQCSYPVYVQTEPTEMSWNGWTDDTVLSPFEKESNSPLFADDFAPDERLEIGNVGNVGVTMLESFRESFPVPPLENIKARQQVLSNTQTHALLSAEAAIFQPQHINMSQRVAVDRQLAQLHLSSSMAITTLKIKALELLERRVVSDAGIGPVRRQSSLGDIDEEPGIQTGANWTTPQKPSKFTIGKNLRIRTSSL
ncbi:hypothetical protein AG0111_0g475 [Alternaria gaisen]|uniref:Uncharacterized protein n=1 Tax=Alternaria gaisen TaxID=167740 RepID=A0ACB6G0I3_9PLEO|nr:hypothetical protein AG0111_0g475 [Alternaria gaisen]